mgnify:CR=1 FL=1
MENQHRLIKTYRELNQTEIDLMNECKLLEAQFHVLHEKIGNHVQKQCNDADISDDNTEYDRLAQATPYRWLDVSKTNVEQGFMALVRAVAQPASPRLEKDN